MRILCRILFAASILLSGVPSNAQNAQKIVDQYLRAAGGAKALSRLQTVTLEGTITSSSTGKSGTYAFITKFPNRFYSELIVGGQHFICSYNGKSPWSQGTSGDAVTLLGPEALQLEAAAQYYNSHLVNAQKKKFTLAVIGHESVGGRDATQIEVTSPNLQKRQVFFDAASHLIVKEVAPLMNAGQEILYRDYRAVDGIQLPHTIEIHRAAQSYEISVSRAAINAPVRETVFDFPKRSQVHLPDLKALFQEIIDNQKKIDKVREEYASTKIVQEDELDSSGKLKKREVSEYQVFYLKGSEIRTLIKKNDKPLSQDEQEKENERVQKRIQEIQSGEGRRAKQEAKRKAKEEKAKEQGKESEEVGISSVLRACQFVNPRHERFRGQDVLVFDFESNPDYKPRNLGERLLQKLVGVMWIDEQAHDVVRLEAYFSDNFKVGGGLFASLHKGTSFAFEQSYVNGEVWLPGYEEVHIGARIALVKSIHVNEITRYSNYKKFNVETLSNTSLPKND